MYSVSDGKRRLCVSQHAIEQLRTRYEMVFGALPSMPILQFIEACLKQAVVVVKPDLTVYTAGYLSFCVRTNNGRPTITTVLITGATQHHRSKPRLALAKIG